MPIRRSEAHWSGGITGGGGTVQVESGSFEARYSAGSRFQNEPGSNPEEMLGAAHAGCFAMALAGTLEKAGYAPQQINVRARVHLDSKSGGYQISRIELDADADVPQINTQEFNQHVQTAEKNCPLSQALSAVDIRFGVQLRKH